MKLIKKSIVLLCSAFLITIAAHAQLPSNFLDSISKNARESVKDSESANETFSSYDNFLKTTDTDFYNAYKSYQIKKFQFTLDSFDNQYQKSNIIFYVVMLIVITGLFLSYKQFALYEKIVSNIITKKESTVVTPADGTATNEALTKMTETSLDVSHDGIKINTAVIGLIIMAMSIIFLILYLQYVYKIEIVKV